jgi:hypothetical protein
MESALVFNEGSHFLFQLPLKVVPYTGPNLKYISHIYLNVVLTISANRIWELSENSNKDMDLRICKVLLGMMA